MWSKKEQPVNQWQANENPRLTDAHGKWNHVMESNKRDIVSKKLMLTMKERCQNIQYIPTCCLLGCVATDQSEYPCWTLSTAESIYKEHMSIWIGPWNNGRRWFGSKNHVFFNFKWIAERMCLTHLENRLHQDTLCEEGKPAEALGNDLHGNLGSWYS